MKLKLRSGHSVPAMLLAMVALLFGSASAFATGALQAQNKGDTNTWVSENAMGWLELDYIPCRVSFGSGSEGDQAVEIDFPFDSGGTPGFENLFSFTCATTNASFVSGPTLTTSPTGNWAYNFTVHISDNNPAEVTFFARLAAGAHANPGSSLHLTGSAGILQIHKPGPGPGLPDLAIVKTGPATIPQGGTITYTLNYTNLASGTNTAFGVQASDALPLGLVVDPTTLPPNAQLVGTNGMLFVFWDLTNVAPGAVGQLTFQAQVPFSITAGTVLTNVAQIESSQNDANPANNISTWLTTVTAGCAGIIVTTPPGNQAACPEDTALFNVVASGTGLTYQWYNGASLLAGQTSNTLSLTNVSAASAGTYSVVIADSCGDTITNSAELTVNSVTLVSTPPINQTVCPGQMAQFSVSATGTDLTYQWYYDNSQMPGATSNVLTLNGVTAANAGTYSVVIMGVCGTAVTNSATLTVNANAMVVTPPSNQTMCPGETARFSVSATGTDLTYQWYYDNGQMPGATSNVLTLNGVTAANAGIYSVVIMGACGTAVTNSATLTVNANTMVVTPPSNQTMCPGETAQFSVSATGTDLTYQWYYGNSQMPGATSNVLTLNGVTAADAGTYSVTITGACGNSVTNSAALVVNNPTLVAVPPMNSTNCPGTTANFSVAATGTDLTYEWFKGSALFLGTNSSITISNVTAEDAGVYTVVVAGACGTSITNSATLVVNATTSVTNAPNDVTSCPGGTVNFTVGAIGTDLSYQWYAGTNLLANETNSTLVLTNVGTSNAGPYSVVIDGACGNPVTNRAMLAVNSSLAVSASPTDQTVCPGGTASFSVGASGTGLTYQWYFGSNLLATQTNSTLTLSNVDASYAGAYSVVMTAACGNAVTNSAMLNVNGDVLVVAPPVNSTNCPGTTASFSINATGSGLVYQWYQGANLLGQTANTLTLTNVNAADAGIYSVVVTGTCSGPISNSAVLVVNADTLVTIPPVNSTNCPGTTAYFSVNATGTDLTYQWYQGANLLPNQTASTLTITNVTAASAGIYSVVVNGACGSSMTNSAILVVNADTLVTIPPANSTNCPGTTANFSVTATGTGLTYAWFKGPAVFLGTNSSISISNVTAQSAGVYTVVVTGACGNSITNSATLVVNADTLVTAPPANATNCPGTMAFFSVNATGTDLTYQWYQGVNALPDQTGSVLALTNVSAASAGTYSVVVAGECGSSVTNSAVLVVNQNVSVAPLASVTNIIGSSATFTAVASGTGPFSYQWFQGNNSLAGQTNSTLTLNNLQPTNGGPYSVSVSGQCGNAATAGFVLTIHLPPVVSIMYPTNGQQFVEPATFNVLACASDPDGTVTNVQFFSSTNGTDFIFLGQTNNTPYLTIASNLPAGTYTLIATATDNLGSTAQSAPVTVEVVPTQPPTVSVIGNLTLNLQDGYQWLSNVVCNPLDSHAEAVRVYIHNLTNSTIQVVNASGTTNGLPYIESPAAIEPGTCWTNVIMFYDPYGALFSPTLTAELVPVPNAAGNPAGVTVPMLPPRMLAGGTFLIEFASTNGATYYVQYSSNMANWNTAFPAITGTGQHMQWIDSGPPATASLPAANVTRFYRVIQAQ